MRTVSNPLSSPALWLKRKLPWILFFAGLAVLGLALFYLMPAVVTAILLGSAAGLVPALSGTIVLSSLSVSAGLFLLAALNAAWPYLPNIMLRFRRSSPIAPAPLAVNTEKQSPSDKVLTPTAYQAYLASEAHRIAYTPAEIAQSEAIREVLRTRTNDSFVMEPSEPRITAALADLLRYHSVKLETVGRDSRRSIKDLKEGDPIAKVITFCAAADPATADPTAADPATADPTAADSAAADPATADPTAADSAAADPTAADRSPIANFILGNSYQTAFNFMQEECLKAFTLPEGVSLSLPLEELSLNWKREIDDTGSTYYLELSAICPSIPYLKGSGGGRYYLNEENGGFVETETAKPILSLRSTIKLIPSAGGIDLEFQGYEVDSNAPSIKRKVESSLRRPSSTTLFDSSSAEHRSDSAETLPLPNAERTSPPTATEVAAVRSH